MRAMFMPTSIISFKKAGSLDTGPEREKRYDFMHAPLISMHVLWLHTNGADNARETDVVCPAENVQVGQVVHGGGGLVGLLLVAGNIAGGQDGLKKELKS